MYCLVCCLIVVFDGSCLAIVISSLGKRNWLLCFSLVCGICVVCHCSLALSRSVISKLYSEIVALPVYLFYFR